MKLAVTDACIFIDLYELQLTTKFFQLDLELHTSVDVFNELFDEQKELLRAYQNTKKLHVHNLTEVDRLEMSKIAFRKGLSISDRTVLFIADSLGAMVLSSDKAVRKQAKKQSIEYHGMLWILDKLVEFQLVDKLNALSKLKQLISTNIIYQNNLDLRSELSKRMKEWTT